MTPEEKAAYFAEWRKNKKRLTAALMLRTRDELLELVLMRTFDLEVLESSYEDLEEREDESDEILYQEFRKKKKFVDVRKKANEQRQSKAQVQAEVMTKAVDDLFQNGQGWKMGNKEIAAFLQEKDLSPYAHGTTINKLKKILPAIKQKYKSGQKNT